MKSFLRVLYRASERHRWIYPLFLAVRFPLILPRLITVEGPAGACRWLRCRWKILLSGRECAFRSRKGFRLSHPMDHAAYDEIFLDRCYDIPELAGHLREATLIADFGTHHGLFIDYARSVGSNAEVFGVEMHPESCAQARRRFAEDSRVHISNVAIGGWPRVAQFGDNPISTRQSLDDVGEGIANNRIDVITPNLWLARMKLTDRMIDVLKMDIEGAEHELLEHFGEANELFRSSRAVVIEIHRPTDVPEFKRRFSEIGLQLIGHRGENHFFRKLSKLD